MKPYLRSERVGGLIRQILADTLVKNISDPRLESAVITEVAMSRDLKLAKIYFCVSGGKKRVTKAANGFKSAAGYMKRVLGHTLNLRYMPKLKFYYDSSFDYGSKIESLLKSIAIQDEENNRSTGTE